MLTVFLMMMSSHLFEKKKKKKKKKKFFKKVSVEKMDLVGGHRGGLKRVNAVEAGEKR